MTITKYKTEDGREWDSEAEGNAWNCFVAAQRYYDQGLYDATIEMCVRGLEYKPNNYEIMLSLYRFRGLAEFKNGDVDKAIATYNVPLKNDPLNRISRSNVLASSGSDYRRWNACSLHLNRGIAYLKKNMTEEAVEDFKTCIEFAPNSGGSYDYLTQYREAAEKYLAIIEETDEWSIFVKAEEFFNAQDYDNTILKYTKYIEVKGKLSDAGDDYKVYINRGESYLKTGKYDQAIADFSEISNNYWPINSDTKAKCFLSLGEAYSRKGNNEQAISEYKKAAGIANDAGIKKQALENLSNMGVKLTQSTSGGVDAPRFKEAKSFWDKDQYDKAIPMLQALANEGSAAAHEILGESYRGGYGVTANREKAFECYGKAAELGYAKGQYKLGFCYEDGFGIKQDWEKAFEWYNKAAEQGYADAQDKLGDIYSREFWGKLNYSKAAEWYRKAAEQGNDSSQRSLNELKEEGHI